MRSRDVDGWKRRDEFRIHADFSSELLWIFLPLISGANSTGRAEKMSCESLSQCG